MRNLIKKLITLTSYVFAATLVSLFTLRLEAWFVRMGTPTGLAFGTALIILACLGGIPLIFVDLIPPQKRKRKRF